MFFTPRYVKEAKALVDAATRMLRYKMDLLSPEKVGQADAAIRGLKEAGAKRDRNAVSERSANLEKVIGQIMPPAKHSAWRENCEVILVAIIIAAGVRAYLVEPFKIPTGSMQPTLNGIIGTPTTAPAPNLAIRAFAFIVQGRTWIHAVATQDDVVVALRERTYANYFTFTDILCENQKYTVFASAATVRHAFNIQEGRILKAGQPIVQGYVDNGDFLLVNKMAYHFSKPERSDVFVWRTTGIELIERTIEPGMGSQHYIKRIGGIPGDELRIAPPNLYVDGALAPGKMFAKVMSEKDGYRGYSNGNAMFNYLTSPEDTFQVPVRSYFALGDNSYNSSDSRFFGPVPDKNVAGKAFVVFWPFTHRWGFIE